MPWELAEQPLTLHLEKIKKSFRKIGSFSSDFGPFLGQNGPKIGSNFEKTQEFQGFERMKFFFMEKAEQKSENIAVQRAALGQEGCR